MRFLTANVKVSLKFPRKGRGEKGGDSFNTLRLPRTLGSESHITTTT